MLIEAYRETKSNGDIMIFEPRKSRGLENLNGLIHAIKNRRIIGFTYLNFWTTKKTQCLAEPYALKEFELR
ncbi:hypothetical protein [Vaginella massiliensis]|uniref:hypothetical protein n=1 Tax=Vaginella massiliensis TaxID=1816680 RepID=UPI000B9BF86F|nr:hypothetical protein [Vaginella massiliensis]